jgi:hypothetical protein
MLSGMGDDETRVSCPPAEMPRRSAETPAAGRRGAYPFDFAADEEGSGRPSLSPDAPLPTIGGATMTRLSRRVPDSPRSRRRPR